MAKLKDHYLEQDTETFNEREFVSAPMICECGNPLLSTTSRLAGKCKLCRNDLIPNASWDEQRDADFTSNRDRALDA